MPIWDYPEPEEETPRYRLSSREYDPDFEYEEARAKRDEED
jgi:hypothetical protein